MLNLFWAPSQEQCVIKQVTAAWHPRASVSLFVFAACSACERGPQTQRGAGGRGGAGVHPKDTNQRV